MNGIYGAGVGPLGDWSAQSLGTGYALPRLPLRFIPFQCYLDFILFVPHEHVLEVNIRPSVGDEPLEMIAPKKLCTS